MKIIEILVEQQIIEGSDRCLLFHSTTLARAKGIAYTDSLRSSTNDGGHKIKDMSFISFSRDSGGQFVKLQQHLTVTFEIDCERLKKHLHGKSHSFDPHVFGKGDQGKKYYRDERETRLNLGDKEPITNLKKFVRAVHIHIPKSIQDRAAVPRSEKPAIVGGLPEVPDPDWEQTLAGFRSPLQISQEQEKTITDLVNTLEEKRIRTHLYLDRTDFLRRNIHNSFRLKQGVRLMSLVKTILTILITKGRRR